MKNGDVVMLKSGGPLMTINSVEDGTRAYCVWFDTTGHFAGAYFDLVTLKYV